MSREAEADDPKIAWCKKELELFEQDRADDRRFERQMKWVTALAVIAIFASIVAAAVVIAMIPKPLAASQ